MEKEIYLLLEKNFELGQLSDDYTLEDLITVITSQIKVWLNRDLEKLLQVCYRIDLCEVKLKNLLTKAPPEQMAELIAKALIQRHIEKIEIRKKFSV